MKKRTEAKTDDERQNELGLRKAIRASANKNVRLNECMIVVRNIQNNFDRQCRRIDRKKRDGGGGEAQQRRIRADMMMRQKIMAFQDQKSSHRPTAKSRQSRTWHQRASDETQEDPEPINNPKMVLGHARASQRKEREDYDDGRIPRYLDSIKVAKGSDIPQEERAVLLAMGANEDDGEEVAVATFNPPHWTSMLAKEWQVREKKEAADANQAKRRPDTARSILTPRSYSRAGTAQRALGGLPPSGSQTARPSTAHVPVLLMSRPGTAAARPRTALVQASSPLSLEAAEVGAVQALRELHHSVQDIFEETPITFGNAGAGDDAAEPQESSVSGMTLNPEFVAESPRVPRIAVGKPAAIIELGGMSVPSTSVILPTKVLTRQLYERNTNSRYGGTSDLYRASTSYIPQTPWHGKFLNNENIRPTPTPAPAPAPSATPIAHQRTGFDNVQSYLKAESMRISKSSAWWPIPQRDMLSSWGEPGQIPSIRQEFASVSPRSRSSAGIRGASAPRPGLKLKLNIPKGPSTNLSPSNISSPRSRPPSARLPMSRTASGNASLDNDDLILASRRVLAREEREQASQQHMSSPTKGAAKHALEVPTWTSPRHTRSADLDLLDLINPEHYVAFES
jgi:hypothetical protein